MSANETPMISSSTPMSLNDATRHEIKSILERPVNLGTYAWSSTDAQLPILMSSVDYDAAKDYALVTLDFPQTIFEKSPLVVDKLKNYQYLHADIEIEVKINAQPFLQGALMLVYNPYIKLVDTFRRNASKFMASQTSCPHKIVSIEEGNSLKLTVPYANIYDLFDLANPDNQFGTIHLYVFSALVGPTGNEKANYTVFARFVNPTFHVPTHIDVVPEIRTQHDISRLRSLGYRVAQSDTAPVASSDTGETQTPGPVSKIASGVTTIADVLSGVPVIGKVAASVAWVSRAIGKTAASLGWSKPTNIIPPTKAVMKPNHSLIHTEGQDDSVTLALIQDNGIDGSSFIPENKDEMSLSYIFGRPNYFHSQTATTDMFSARKLITAWEVSPFSQYQYRDVSDSSTLSLGSFAYASMFGTLWRGTINYDIMVIKTPYHQGRFAVVFLPETNVADVPQTLGELLNTNYNVVCNLKDRQDEMGRTQFRVSVPYISNVPWRKTFALDTNGAPDATTFATKTGCLAIYSLVDLTNPPTVSGSVTFYIAHSGGDDYQICRPKLQLTPGFAARYAQGDTGTVQIPVDENLLVPSHGSMDVTAQTSGEYFTSLRALVKRFGKIFDLSQNSEYLGIKTRLFREDPEIGRRVCARANFSTPAYPTPWYMVSFLYRFYHGSSMLKILNPVPGSIADAFINYDDDNIQIVTENDKSAIGNPLYKQLQQVSNIFEIRTPYYRAIRGDVVAGTADTVLGDVRTYIRSRNLAGYGGQSQSSDIFEAAGDDFNYYFMVGPPVMSSISLLETTPPRPVGTARTADFSALGAVNIGVESGIRFLKYPVPFTPSISNNPDFYKITESSVQFLPVVDTTGNTQLLEFTSAESADRASVSSGIYLPIPTSLDVDLAATQTEAAKLGTVSFVDEYPVGEEKLTSVERAITYGSVDQIFGASDSVLIRNISISPVVPAGFTALPIVSSSPATIRITYTDASFEDVLMTSCVISTTAVPSLVCTITSVGKEVDEAATIASLSSVTHNVVTLF